MNGATADLTGTGTSKRVLVADDEKHTRVALSIILRKAGFRVTAVEDGLQALKTLLFAIRQSTPFDLLIIDIQMPGLTGIEFVDEISKLGVRFPILLITGYRDIDKLAELRCRYCVEYAEKPFNPDELLKHVSRLLARFEHEHPKTTATIQKSMGDGEQSPRRPPNE
jgi:DNA-binding NtrC family response regulator